MHARSAVSKHSFPIAFKRIMPYFPSLRWAPDEHHTSLQKMTFAMPVDTQESPLCQEAKVYFDTLLGLKCPNIKINASNDSDSYAQIPAAPY